MTRAPTRAEILAIMEAEAATIVEMRVKAYFAAGSHPRVDQFLADMARPFVGALMSVGLNHVRMDDGGPTAFADLVDLVRDGLTAALAAETARKPASPETPK
jgi:hypothetical protein